MQTDFIRRSWTQRERKVLGYRSWYIKRKIKNEGWWKERTVLQRRQNLKTKPVNKVVIGIMQKGTREVINADKGTIGWEGENGWGKQTEVRNGWRWYGKGQVFRGQDSLDLWIERTDTLIARENQGCYAHTESTINYWGNTRNYLWVLQNWGELLTNRKLTTRIRSWTQIVY